MGGTLPAAARGVTRSGDVRRQRRCPALRAQHARRRRRMSGRDIFPPRGLRHAHDAVAGRGAELCSLRCSRGCWTGAIGSNAGRVRVTKPAALSLHAAPPHLPACPRPSPFSSSPSATVGFAFFLMELVWYRLLGPLLGGSVFTFGLVLAVALVGIGIGGLFYSLIGRDRPASLSGFAVCCLLEAAAVAATFALGDRVALLALALLPLGAVGFTAAIGGWTLVTAIVVLPPGDHRRLSVSDADRALRPGPRPPRTRRRPGLRGEHHGRDLRFARGRVRRAAVAHRARRLAPGGGGARRARPRRGRLRRGRKAREARKDKVGILALAAITLLLLAAAGPTAIWRHGGIGAGRRTDAKRSRGAPAGADAAVTPDRRSPRRPRAEGE